jgi:uncharacterized damage-inducible protein DinB
MRKDRTETERIKDLLVKAHRGGAWHGPSLLFALRGVTAAEAVWRPAGGNTHNIWEIVLHVTGWMEVVALRARGRGASRPAQGDWPLVAERNEGAWRIARLSLNAAYQDVLAALDELEDRDLDRRAGSRTVRENLLGTLEHMAYHAGQIRLLQRMCGKQTGSLGEKRAPATRAPALTRRV